MNKLIVMNCYLSNLEANCRRCPHSVCCSSQLNIYLFFSKNKSENPSLNWEEKTEGTLYHYKSLNTFFALFCSMSI